MSPPGPNLASLPFELLENIVSNVNTARDIAALSRTCRAVNYFIESYGWNLFVREWFEAQAEEIKQHKQMLKNSPPIIWPERAKQLTYLARNWERRTFQVRLIEPRFCSGIGMYDPVIDCWDGRSLDEDRLVIGVGSNIMVRRRKRTGSGSMPKEEWGIYTDLDEERYKTLPHDSDNPDNPDTITFVKILSVDFRPPTALEGSSGSFSGELVLQATNHSGLEMVELEEASDAASKDTSIVHASPKGCKKLFRYATGDKYISAVGVSPRQDVVAAALDQYGIQELAIYPVYPADTQPLGEGDSVAINETGVRSNVCLPILVPRVSRVNKFQGRIFTKNLNFLSSDRFVVTNCRSMDENFSPLLVYHFASIEGIRQEPIWESKHCDALASCAVKVPDGANSDRKTESSGQLILSGWSDGNVR